VRQQRADDFQRDAVAVGQRRVGMAKLVRRERKADLALRALDDPVDVGVRQRQSSRVMWCRSSSVLR
jgi:hypothetical protein